MMAAATVHMNQKIISTNLDIIEEQRGQIYHAVDQYVDKVIDAGRQWLTRKERNHATFLEIHKITSKAMLFLSLKCDEMKSELESETSDLIGRNEFTQQQKHAQKDPAGKPATTHEKGKEDGTGDVKRTHTFTHPNLESDQQSRYQDVYNQLQSVLAKQDELEQQLNMKLNNLREDTESLKSDVGTFNQYVETGKALLEDYSQKLESLENTVSCLSGNVNEMYSDKQVLVDRINSHLSVKDDQVITDLSAKVDQINTDLTDKVDQVNKNLLSKVSQINTELSDKVGVINTDLSAKVNQITTDLTGKVDQVNKDVSAKVGKINTYLKAKDIQINAVLSAKVDQINVALQSLTNSEKEHAAQMNKITDLEKHVHTIEKDTQNNDKQVQQMLDEVVKNLLDATQKLTDLSVTVATTYAKKSDLGAVGFNAERNFPYRDEALSVVGMFEAPTFIAGCQFNSETGIFTAPSVGIYLTYVSMCLHEDGHSRVYLIREYTAFDEIEGLREDEAEICWIQAEKKGSTVYSLDIITMGEADKLFIRTCKYPVVSFPFQFLCFRIG